MNGSTETFGSRLRAARLAAGMSQSAVAARCGIPKPRLSRYENDHILPSLSSLRLLAGAVGVAQEELLTGSPSGLEIFVEELRRADVEFRDADEARSVASEIAARYGPASRTQAAN